MSTQSNNTLDRIKDEIALEQCHTHRWEDLYEIDKTNLWPYVCERYATEKAKEQSSGRWTVATPFTNQECLMKDGVLELALTNQDLCDLLNAKGFTLSQVEASIAASLERAAENARTHTGWQHQIDKLSITDKSNHVIV